MKFNLRLILTIISITSIPCIAVGIEPVGAIGQPLPKKHVFYDNDTILRVVPNSIQIVNVNTGAVEDEFGNLNDYSEVAFSHNASHVAVLNDYAKSNIISVDIWDVNTRELTISWEIESEDNYIPIFSPVTPLFATVSNNEIHLWNWQTGNFIDTMVGERRPLESCYVRQNGKTCGGSRQITPTFTPDGKHLIVASARPDIEIWNVERRELVGHFERHIGNWVEGAAISSDGTRMSSFDREPGIVYVWDMETRQLIWKLKSGSNYVTDVAFTPDSQHLYVATKTKYSTTRVTDPSGKWEDEIRVWDIHTGLQIDTIETKFHDIDKISLSPDGNRLLLHYKDVEVLWEIEEKRERIVWADFIRFWWNEVTTSLDGNTLASVSRHTIKTWDLTTQEMQLLIPNEGYDFRGVAVSPDSEKLAVGRGLHRWIELRDLRTGEVDKLLPHSLSYVEKIVYGHSGRWLAVSDDWDELAILDIENSENSQPLHIQVNLGKYTNFVDFGFSKDDVYFAASAVTGINGNYEYWTLLWKRVDDKYVFQYVWNPSFYYLPTFTTTPDRATVLATTDRDGIHIWKLLPDAPQLLTTLPGNGPLQFSPDGRYLFANRDNESFQIWDWQVNRPIKHQPIPRCFSISQDGSVLTSYDNDLNSQFLIWDTQNILSSLPYSVEPNGKKIVTLGQVKRNQLMQNFPNPFNPETWIPFQLADESYVIIHIYTPSGKLVRTLTPGILSVGEYTSQSKATHWDGQNNDGEPVSSGIYLYTISADNFSATRKMSIIK